MSLGCQCQNLTVSLSNNVLTKQGNRQDTYELSETIHGKPSWKSSTQAIWYYPEFTDWAIGPLSNIGTNFRGITSVGEEEYDCPQQVPKDKWDFWDGSNWLTANLNDISFQCTGKE